MTDPAPVTLLGRHVRLKPMLREHASQLWSVGEDSEIWRYMPFTVTSLVQMQAWVNDMLSRQAAGRDLPFVVIDVMSGAVIGATRFMEIDRAHRSLEIGGTWYGKAYRRTAVNTECKYLLMRHAFETLGCIRVQLKTDLRNERSQRAIERLGAVREGVLRKNMLMPDGYQRSSVMYSVIDDDWPGVKARLEQLLQQ